MIRRRLLLAGFALTAFVVAGQIAHAVAHAARLPVHEEAAGGDDCALCRLSVTTVTAPVAPERPATIATACESVRVARAALTPHRSVLPRSPPAA